MVASSTVFNMLEFTPCGKNLNMYDVANSSTLRVSVNLKPLYVGESNNAKADITFFRSDCERAAVLELTTTRIRVSYPGYLVFSSIVSTLARSRLVSCLSSGLASLPSPLSGGFHKASMISFVGPKPPFLPLFLLTASASDTDFLVQPSLAGLMSIWIPMPSSLPAELSAFNNAREASRFDS